MAYCHQCAKLEDAAEAATLDYEELVAHGNASQEALSQARDQRDLLRRQLTEHKVTHTAASA